VVQRANEAGQPLHIVVLERKKDKNELKKCIFQPVFLGVFIDDIRIFKDKIQKSYVSGDIMIFV